MKLGVHVGYWGLGLKPDEQLSIVQEAERLGYDSVWAAEAYGSDAATVLAWLAAGTSKIKLGSAIFQMPGAERRDDGDDGGHARPDLRRADAAGDRRVRPPGGGGLARPAVRQAAPAHARVRGGRAQGAVAREARVPRRDDRAAAARRAGQGAEADDLPRPGADPDLPGGDRPEEHGAGGRDRRRVDPDAVLAGARGGVPPAARGGRGARRGGS